MSHTNHRSGSVESLKHDFVVLSFSQPGMNREGSAEKQRHVMEIFLEHNAINMGYLGFEGCVTWDNLAEAQKQMQDNNNPLAVITTEEDLIALLKELKDADMGLSVTVSGLFNDVHECCQKAGLEPHTVNMSLGIWGAVDRLPADERTTDVTTMCGHGMIPFSLVEDAVNKVRNEKMTAEQAAEKLSPNCSCHIFNTERAARIIAEMAREAKENSFSREVKCK